MKTISAPESVGLSRVGLARLDAHIRGYVDAGKMPGGLALVARKGEVAHLSTMGLADVERGVPVAEDTIYRLHSMTKPLTSVALMQLHEAGKVQLDDPVHKYIPAWEGQRVYVSGEYPDFRTREADRPMTVRDLLSHQSGLVYGMDTTAVDEAYVARGLMEPGKTLDDLIERLADLPLLFSPGARWNYSVSTDVCGYLVQLLSGQKLDDYIASNITGPLGMVDTAFEVAPQNIPRFAANYGPAEGGGLTLIDDPRASIYTGPQTFLSGGGGLPVAGGLTGTAGDYWRFAQALADGGELDGTRIIGRKTLELMTSNHLSAGGDIASVGYGPFTGSAYHGVGFGLGFSVLLDPARSGVAGSRGEIAWGGASTTLFFVDPAEELVFVFMTQLRPLWTYDVRREFRSLVYGGLT